MSSSWRHGAGSTPVRTGATARAASARYDLLEPIGVGRAAEKTRLQLGRIWQVLSLWRRRSRDRAMLRSLSQRDLQDFCPRLADAEAEMNKPFWRA